MAQVKIYGLRDSLSKHRNNLSEAIQASLIEALAYPPEKRFQRFIALDPADFIYPEDRSREYTVIEVSLFQGRSVAAKKAFIRALYRNIAETCGIREQDVEITLFETPKENWGIRGLPGDELSLNYKVEV
ncbi:MAG: tautomerase family protein [Candidatus Thiodiazotropha sp.]|jgi:phenylpyruvate tautomerase PptA (4-oxalocrotonate tautomerase family)